MNRGLSLSIGQNQNHKRITGIVKAVTALCLFTGIQLFLARVYGLHYQFWFGEAVGFLVIAVLSAFWDRESTVYSLFLIITGFFVVGFLLGSKFAVNGLFILLNQAIDAIGVNTPHIFTKFAVEAAENNYVLYATFFMVFFSAVLSGLCAAILNGGYRSLLLLLAIAVILPPALFGIVPGRWTCLFFAASLLLAYGVTGMGDQQEGTWPFLLGTVLTVFLLTSALASWISPQSGVHPVFEEAVARLRYEKEPEESYPKGQLSKMGRLEKQKDPALYVTMENPVPLYLKGYVGSRFDGQNWQDLEQSVHYENYPLFYWLHRQGFYGFDQTFLLYSLQGTDGAGPKTYTMKVDHVGGDSRYYYLPYELASASSFDFRRNSDTAALTKGFFGQRTYSFRISESLADKTGVMGKKLFELQQQGDEDALRYLSQESYYNLFVYQAYTALTDEQKEVFSRLTEKEVDPQAAHMEYGEAENYVKKFLADTLVYDEKADLPADSDDFLRKLLMEDKKGNDVHFATVAALLYRYLGIPARYVEGYALTKAGAEKMKPGEPYALSGADEHAWVEVYYDTIGWLPVEVTPGFDKLMEAAQDSQQNIQGENGTENREETVPQTADPKKQESGRNKKTEQKGLSATAILFLLWILVFAGLILGILLRKLWTDQRRKRDFAAENNCDAVRGMYGYFVRLMKAVSVEGQEEEPKSYKEMLRQRCPSVTEADFETWVSHCQKAAYSEEGVTKEERQWCGEFVERIRKELYGQQDFLRKLVFLFWECV